MPKYYKKEPAYLTPTKGKQVPRYFIYDPHGVGKDIIAKGNFGPVQVNAECHNVSSNCKTIPHILEVDEDTAVVIWKKGHDLGKPVRVFRQARPTVNRKEQKAERLKRLFDEMQDRSK